MDHGNQWWHPVFTLISDDTRCSRQSVMIPSIHPSHDAAHTDSQTAFLTRSMIQSLWKSDAYSLIDMCRSYLISWWDLKGKHKHISFKGWMISKQPWWANVEAGCCCTWRNMFITCFNTSGWVCESETGLPNQFVWRDEPGEVAVIHRILN